MKKYLLPALLSAMLVACGSTGTSTDSAAGVSDAGVGVATVTAPGMSGCSTPIHLPFPYSIN